MAFSWKNRVIPAYSTHRFSILVGAGAVNKPPAISISSPDSTFGKVAAGRSYSFSGNVSDIENSSATQVYYRIDDTAPVLAHTFPGAPGNFRAEIFV